MEKRLEDYDGVEDLINENKVKTVIVNIFSLEKASEAFEFAEKGRPRGKVIIKL